MKLQTLVIILMKTIKDSLSAISQASKRRLNILDIQQNKHKMIHKYHVGKQLTFTQVTENAMVAMNMALEYYLYIMPAGKVIFHADILYF